MASFSTVGFDLDLTLVDTKERILFAARRGFADVGFEVGDDELVPLLGFPLAHKAARLAPTAPVAAFVQRYRFHYRSDEAPACPAEPGAAAALEAVRNEGGRCVVVSAKQGALVHEALERAGLAEAVSAVHGELFAAQKATALRAEEAQAYVGDHPGDIEAARVAGAVAIGVATGANDTACLREAGADVVFASLLEFPDWYRSDVM